MMTYETETTKTMTNRELAEAIVDDRIAHGQFGADDLDWLVERELRETRESLVNAFNAIERWADDDIQDSENEPEDDQRAIFDGDFGALLDGCEWQYDMDAITDMTTEMDWETCTLMWKRPDDMPAMDDIAACQWTPITENVRHLIEACEQGHQLPSNIFDIDEEKVIERLSVVDEDGQRVWRDVSLSEVASVIYDEALLTSENADTWAADDMPEHIDGMWDILWWSGTAGAMKGVDDETGLLRTILSALTDDDGQWKLLVHADVHDIILDCIKDAKNL